MLLRFITLVAASGALSIPKAPLAKCRPLYPLTLTEMKVGTLSVSNIDWPRVHGLAGKWNGSSNLTDNEYQTTCDNVIALTVGPLADAWERHAQAGPGSVDLAAFNAEAEVIRQNAYHALGLEGCEHFPVVAEVKELVTGHFKTIVAVLTDGLSKGVPVDGYSADPETHETVYSYKFLLAGFIAAGLAALGFNLLVMETHTLQGMRPFKRKRCPKWPHPAPGSLWAKLNKLVLLEQLRQTEDLAVVILSSAPAYEAFGLTYGDVTYDRLISSLKAVPRLAAKPILFLAKQHPAAARFSRSFWSWAAALLTGTSG